MTFDIYGLTLEATWMQVVFFLHVMIHSLKERKPEDFLHHLCVAMEEPDQEKAATALQRRYEAALSKDKDLRRAACFG